MGGLAIVETKMKMLDLKNLLLLQTYPLQSLDQFLLIGFQGRSVGS